LVLPHVPFNIPRVLLIFILFKDFILTHHGYDILCFYTSQILGVKVMEYSDRTTTKSYINRKTGFILKEIVFNVPGLRRFKVGGH
jgi:hypothetical protein